MLQLDSLSRLFFFLYLFFFNDTATTEIYTLSLHDALPILSAAPPPNPSPHEGPRPPRHGQDRKSTRLNSSHLGTSYAVFCLKKTIRDFDREHRFPLAPTNNNTADMYASAPMHFASKTSFI